MKKTNHAKAAAKTLHGAKKATKAPVVDAEMWGPDKNPKIKGHSKTPDNSKVGKGVKDKSEKAGTPPPMAMQKQAKGKKDAVRRKRNIGR